jgi:hypothetical protein
MVGPDAEAAFQRGQGEIGVNLEDGVTDTSGGCSIWARWA